MCTTNPTFTPTCTTTLPKSCWGLKKCFNRSSLLIAIHAQLISTPIDFQGKRTITTT